MNEKRATALSWLIIAASVAALGWMNWQRHAGGGVFPSRPVTLICPYAPGGGTDLLCRVLAHEAEQRLGQPVLVNNVTGGAGAVGFAAGQLAAADGHTALMTTFELVSLPVQGLAPFTYEDFDLLMLLNMDPGAVAVRADSPVATLSNLVAAARTGKAPRVGNSGTGAVWHLAAALFAERAGAPLTHVPFTGSSPAITALIGGHVDAVIASPAELKTYVESGQLRLLGVMSAERLPNATAAPTCREQGVDLVFGTWRGLALPKGVAAATRAVLRDTFREAITSDALAAFAVQSGMNLQVLESGAFQAMVREQAVEVAQTMKRVGLAK
jgi:tripartite-type tricarboxylate transporter receptor subunit TctC